MQNAVMGDSLFVGCQIWDDENWSSLSYSYNYHPFLRIHIDSRDIATLDLELKDHYRALWVKAGVQAMLSLILNAKGECPGKSA